MKRRTDAKSMLIIIGSIFALLGFIFTAVGVISLIKDMSFMRNAETTDAVITDIESEHYGSGEDRKTRHTVWVEYTVDGTDYSEVLNEMTDNYSSSMREGKSIKVYYDPDNPSDVRTVSYVLEIVFFSLGLPFLIVGVIFAAVNISAKKKIKRLIQNGEAVTGKIINVRMNVNVRINNMHPYKADCEVINPFDGQRYLYSSGNITYDIRNFTGEDVTVYIDRKNPKNYYVDVEGLIEKKTAVSGNDYIDYRK